MNKGFALIWGKTFFPTQNFTSVSAGRNRDDMEKQVRLVLYANFQDCLFGSASYAWRDRKPSETFAGARQALTWFLSQPPYIFD